MVVNGIEGDGAIQNYFNQGMFEEMSYQTSALGAVVQSSGVRLNMIPRDGSNVFKGSLFWSHTPGDWQSNNFTDELKATGLRAPNRVELIRHREESARLAIAGQLPPPIATRLPSGRRWRRRTGRSKRKFASHCAWRPH